MDLSMPGIGGLETISRIVSKDNSPKILILSAHEDAIHPKRSLKAGANGYLSKRGAAEELIKAIDKFTLEICTLSHQLLKKLQ